MAYTGVKTDWSAADFMTASDLNRIAGNINYLYPDANLKSNYTQNDFLKASEWSLILVVLDKLKVTLGINTPLPDNTMDFNTFNELESLVLELKNRQDFVFRQDAANHYSGELFVSENYTRGI